MTEVILLPDVEQLLYEFLTVQPEVITLVSTRVYSELPDDKQFPLVRIHQYGSLPEIGHARWLTTATVQFDAYGGTKKQAKTLAETCAGVMHARLIGSHNQGVVTGVTFTGWRAEPDATFTPAQPRTLFTGLVTAHP